MPRIVLRLLGPPQLEIDGQPLVLETRKALALLAYLAVKGERQTRESLVALLWPDSDRSHGLAVLRRTLYAINKTAAGDCLESTRASVGLRREPSGGVVFWTDTVQFHESLTVWREHGHPEDEPCQLCLHELDQAADLYRGDFLSGFTLADTVNFDDWQFFQSEALRGELAVCLTRLVKGCEAAGDLEPALLYARRLLSLDRLDEEAHRSLMRLYARMGRRGAAVRQYQECVRILGQELGVEPMAQTVALHQAIRAGTSPDPAAGTHRAEGDRPAPAGDSLSGSARPITVVHVRGRGRGEDSPDLLHDLVAQAADLYGGERLHGQGDLIAFGRIRMREGDPELAVRAALQLRRWARRGRLGLGIGVSTGSATMERLGDGVVAAGSAPRLAARLASSAQNGQILVGESTYRTTRDAFEYRPVHLDSTKIGRPMRLYEAQRLLAFPQKTRGIEGFRSRLVGRDSELYRLKELFREAVAGRGHIVTLIGDAGVGKSRLVSELHDHIADRQPQAVWLEGRCLELGRGASYWPFLDLLRGFFRPTAENDSDQVSVASAVQALVIAGVLDAERGYQVSERISRLLAGTEKPPVSESPEQAKHETFLALRDFFQALSLTRPLALVLEDLHWSDSLSLDLIPMLMDCLDRSPILLLCVYRPEEENRCWRLAAIASSRCPEKLVELRLRDLTPGETQDLTASLLETTDLSQTIQQLVFTRTRGNPLFVEEVVRSLIEGGHLENEEGVWRLLDGPRDKAGVPQGVRSVIMGRVERLGAGVRSALELASVVGSLFRRSVLEKVLGDWADLDESLWELERRALIYETRSVPEVEYSFKHVLTQETVYSNMAEGRRVALHREVADALEFLHGSNLEQAYEVLALHWERAGDVGRAVDYLLAAGTKASAGYANLEAIAHLSRGLDLLVTLPASERTAEREKQFLLSLGTPLVLTRGHADSEVARTYVRAEELCRATSDQDGLFQSVLGSRRFHFARGNTVEAYRLSEILVSMAETSVQHARALFMLGELLLDCGQFAAASDACERALELCGVGDSTQQIRLYENDGECGAAVLASTAWWFLGRAERALALVDRAERIATSLAHPFNLAMTLFYAARVYRLLGRTDEVRIRAERIMVISQERQYPLYHAMALHFSGWATARDGNVERGVVMMSQGLDEWRVTGAQVFVPAGSLYIGEALMKAGRLEEARSAFREAEEVLGRTDRRAWEPELYRLQGELARAAGDAAGEVERLLLRSIEVAREQKALAWQLRSTTTLARFLADNGRQSEAKTLVAEICAAFIEGFDEPDFRSAQDLLAEL